MLCFAAEAIASGETNIKSSYLTRYINSLQSNYSTTEAGDSNWQLLQRHFNQITQKKPLETQFSAATMPCNQLKNQSFDFLPIDSTRVKLPLIPDLEVRKQQKINNLCIFLAPKELYKCKCLSVCPHSKKCF